MPTKKIPLVLCLCAAPIVAKAEDYRNGNWLFRLNADGMVGFLETREDKPIFINDWEIKGQIFYNLNNISRFGAVYSIDADAVDDNKYIHDAFVYLRINDKSILYKKLDLKRVLISDTTATTGHETLRLNLATHATEHGQYGLSFSTFGNDYNYAIDGAFKIKRPHGKLKSAYYIAVAYIDKPENYVEASFSPKVTADWRGQVAAGVNLQYNSFIWGTSARVIYDNDPIAKTADGFIAGTGVSYDFLQSSLSLNYLFSDTNLWNHRDKDTDKKMSGDYVHTILSSFRYKYTEQTSVFMSGGFTDTKLFFAVGIRSGF